MEQYSSIFPGNAKKAKIITQPINSNIPLRSRANVGLAASGYVFISESIFTPAVNTVDTAAIVQEPNHSCTRSNHLLRDIQHYFDSEVLSKALFCKCGITDLYR